MKSGYRSLQKLMLAIMLGLFATGAQAADSVGAIGVRHISLVDATRAVKASMGFAGSAERRLDVTVWYPAPGPADSASRNPGGQGLKHPLIIYSHGSFGRADNAMHLVNSLVGAGYIVAAADYPLSSRAAYTRIAGPDPSDVIEQTRDIRFIIDRLLADKDLSLLVDPARIATIGHSLGAVTSYFTSFASGVRDPRIKAAVLLGAGDPVQAALSGNMGLGGTWNAAASVPVLFMNAQHDPFAAFTGRPHAAYSRVETPKYEITVNGGAHVWFTDNAVQPADGSNPDCAMLKGLRPGGTLPGCEAGNKMATPQRQQEITRIAVRAFLDGYLKNDATQLRRLRRLHAQLSDTDIRFEE